MKNDKEANIQLIIQGCRRGNRNAQRKLYQLFFSYAMSVSVLYSTNKEDAEEIMNTSFLKVFKKIDQFDEAYSFKPWFRSILIHTSIDYFRKYKKLKAHSSENLETELFTQNTGLDNLLYLDIIEHIQLLPPQYRLVFNLYAIERFKHHEIAEKLNISIGTSKSNYAKARRKLQYSLKKSNEVTQSKNGR